MLQKSFFKGKLDETTLEGITKVDYEVVHSKNRVKVVEEILKSTNFFNVYSDNFYNVNLNTEQTLSENVNVFKKLESYADYILKADDIKRNKIQYNFYKDKTEFKKKVGRESLHMNSEQSEGEVLDFLVRSNKNFYKPKQQTIGIRDLNDIGEMGRILREYEKLCDILMNRNTKHLSFYRKISMTKAVKNDMIYVKNSMKGVLDSNTTPSNFSQIYDMFDWKNENHVKELLLLSSNFDTTSDLGFLKMDLDIVMKRLIKYGIISELEETIYNMINDGYKPIELAEEIGITRSAVSKRMLIMTKKICRHTTN